MRETSHLIIRNTFFLPIWKQSSSLSPGLKRRVKVDPEPKIYTADLLLIFELARVSLLEFLYLKGKNGAFSKSTTNVQIASHYHPSIEALASIHFEYVSSIQWDALKWGVTKTFSIVVVCHHALRVLFNGDHEWHPSGKKVLCVCV